jgi:DivIVA domain-containing protein
VVVTLLGILGALVVIGAAAVLATRPGGELVDVEQEHPDSLVPEAGMVADDLHRVRFAMVVRGYRMAEVDEVVDRAATALDEEQERSDKLAAELTRALDALRSAEGRASALQADLLRREGGTPTGPPTEAPTGAPTEVWTEP